MINRSRLLAYAAAQPWVMQPEAGEALFAALYLRATGSASVPILANVFGPDAAALGPLAPYASGMHGNKENAIAKRSGAVAVIPCFGVVTPKATMADECMGVQAAVPSQIAQAASEAADDPDVKAIVLAVDSPGGSSSGVQECFNALVAAREKKPLVTHVVGTMASAAYWLGSAGESISANESAMTGSIGAYMYHEDWSEAYAKEGVKPTYIKAGANKAEFNQELPLTDEARAHIQEIVDDCYNMFTSSVAQGRGITTAVAQGEQYGEGRMFMAGRAQTRGMVDKVRSFADTLNALGAGGPSPAPVNRGGSRALALAQAQLRLSGLRPESA